MKINSSNDPALAATAAVTAKTGRGAATSSGAPASIGTVSGAPVSVSATARVLDGATAGSGIDSAKVAAMRSAIADGTFTVNAERIVDKLLSNAQEFLSRSRN